MPIPAWPASRPLALEDKAFFDHLFRQTQPLISEFTFAGLYLFRHAHHYRISLLGELVIIAGAGYDGQPYAMMPLGTTGADAGSALATLLSSGLPIYGADEAFISRYDDSGNYSLTAERDAFDYLYQREELANLPGNRFHKKKNRIQYFTSRHTFRSELFAAEHRDQCLQLLKTLQQSDRSESSSSRLEYEAAAEALQLRETLGLEGVVIEVGGAIKAFALGERLNRETALCQFEKGDHFLDGIIQLVNREFSRLLFNDCRLINRGQDLGVAGLRTAKLSYRPFEMVKKYRLQPKHSA